MDDDHDDDRYGPLRLTRRDFDDLHERSVGEARDYAERAQRDDGPDRGEMMKRVAPLLARGAGAFGVGYLAGRSGSSSIGATGIPIGLAAGFATYFASYMGWTSFAGDYEKRILDAADGAIDTWWTILGARMGSAAAERAGRPPTPLIAGAPDGAQVSAAPIARGLAGPPPYQTSRQPPAATLAAETPPPPAREPPPNPNAAPLTEAELQNIAQERMRNYAL